VTNDGGIAAVDNRSNIGEGGGYLLYYGSKIIFRNYGSECPKKALSLGSGGGVPAAIPFTPRSLKA
jgi:hypothetical protein